MKYPMISYDILNNFTQDSILNHINTKYNLKLKEIHPDPSWYGRGSLELTEEEAVRLNEWENELSECFEELEFEEEEEGTDNE